MEVNFSSFLESNKQNLKKLINILTKKFEYASVLGTDCVGKRYAVSKKNTNITNNNWNERGFVVRIFDQGYFYEYSFNCISEDTIEQIAQKIITKYEQKLDINTIKFDKFDEENISESMKGQIQISPYEVTAQSIIESLDKIVKEAFSKCKYLVEFGTVFSYTHISKIFLSNKRDLQQSYIWSEAYLFPTVRRGNITKDLYESFSGLEGVEIIQKIQTKLDKVLTNSVKLLDSKPIQGGEYEVICSPEAVGVIVHEAFGHGVEMDMFVRNRAKGFYYLGKNVASTLINMKDGANSYKHVSSYLFDDEGTLGTDTTVIKDGILQDGISDLLSAYKLGKKPSGNGKRESYKKKAYSRMTNTFFESGKSKVEDMIKSIKHGYFIEKSSGGMEDPKDWGIQIMFNYAIEIVEGKLTDNIVSPVVMTGNVPELLQNITMISEDFGMYGSGACGKGYKEFVKVSDGGPYIKTRARLG